MFVTGPPVIVIHPTDDVINATTSTTLHCEATGSGMLIYWWENDHEDERRWREIQGSNCENFIVRNLPYSEKYRCIVTNEAGRTVSNTVTVYLMGKLLIYNGMIFSNVSTVIITQPVDSTFIALEDATLTCLSSVDEATYLWHRIGDSVPARSNGKNNSILTIPAVTPYDAGVYYCIAKKEEITVGSNKAELSIDGRELK